MEFILTSSLKRVDWVPGKPHTLTAALRLRVGSDGAVDRPESGG
jgi:hypothetical protein